MSGAFPLLSLEREVKGYGARDSEDTMVQRRMSTAMDREVWRRMDMTDVDKVVPHAHTYTRIQSDQDMEEV